MIRGRVDAQRQARVQLEIESGDGGLEPIDTVVETGFDGHLTLPSQVIAELGLEPDEPSDVVLATGSRERVNIWRGSVLWHDKFAGFLSWRPTESLCWEWNLWRIAS